MLSHRSPKTTQSSLVTPATLTNYSSTGRITPIDKVVNENLRQSTQMIELKVETSPKITHMSTK